MSSLWKRGIATVVAILCYGWVNYLLHPAASILVQNRIATKQFEDSDTSFLISYYGMDFFRDLGIPFIALLVVLLVIWWKPLRGLLSGIMTLMLVVMAAQFIGTTDARAYATNGTNVTEWRGIQPDETAFLVPLFGDTLDSQAQYQPAYLNSKGVKIPGKFIQIPHSKLSGTGGTSGLASVFGVDYTVNTSVLYLVKRSPFSRVWTKSGRGTNKDVDESFNCQTKGGHNVLHIGIAIQTAIADADAALYFSHFGPEPLPANLDMNRIENNFISVRYARSLISVTDDTIYTKAHKLVCFYIAQKKDPAEASDEMNDIMANVERDLTKYAIAFGITLKDIGWADTWDFDPDVQAAMNQKFNAKMVGDSLDVLARNADINLKEGMAAGFRKGMPSFLAVPETLMAPLLAGSAGKPAIAAPQDKKK